MLPPIPKNIKVIWPKHPVEKLWVKTISRNSSYRIYNAWEEGGKVTINLVFCKDGTVYQRTLESVAQRFKGSYEAIGFIADLLNTYTPETDPELF